MRGPGAQARCGVRGGKAPHKKKIDNIFFEKIVNTKKKFWTKKKKFLKLSGTYAQILFFNSDEKKILNIFF